MPVIESVQGARLGMRPLELPIVVFFPTREAGRAV